MGPFWRALFLFLSFILPAVAGIPYRELPIRKKNILLECVGNRDGFMHLTQATRFFLEDFNSAQEISEETIRLYKLLFQVKHDLLTVIQLYITSWRWPSLHSRKGLSSSTLVERRLWLYLHHAQVGEVVGVNVVGGRGQFNCNLPCAIRLDPGHRHELFLVSRRIQGCKS